MFFQWHQFSMVSRPKSSFYGLGLKTRGWKDLTVNQRITHNGLKMLSEYQQTRISVPSRPSKYPLEFKGRIGNVILDFLKHRQQGGTSRCSFHNNQRHLYEFLEYCENQGIDSVLNIDLPILLHFINRYDCDKNTVIKILISTLRVFMQYLFRQNLTAIDYSAKIPRHKTVVQPKLPSLYSKEEVERLVASPDRSAPVGKRNFAIITLAARLGLRASDISRIKI